MNWMERKIGVAFTGSFCTYKNAFLQLRELVDTGAQVYTIFSETSQKTDSRFGRSSEFLQKAKEITGREVICTIPQAEPIGPKNLFDVLVILPCTGNTMAKLANGITDSPVLMAAKAHLRNEKPLVLSVATNDALAMNMKNMGLLMNAKHIYFVPFGQDQPLEKPNSLIAHTTLLIPTIEAALEGHQYQPVIQTFH